MKELDIEITGKEKYKVESDLVAILVGISVIVVFILGAVGGEPTGGFVMAMVIAIIIHVSGNILFLFTPFYYRKKEKRDKIYDYFKSRFYQINEFLPSKYHKEGEEILNTRRKSPDDIMFDIYMKAYQLNADAIIINDIVQYNKNCVFVKVKE
ncbi:MAG: hypothetical protein AB7D96_02250 [Arcobacteraceae bacterium]